MLQVHKVCGPECVCWHIWEWACSISKLCRVTWPTIIPWEVIVYWTSMDQEQNTKTNILMHRLVHVDVIQMKSHFLWCLIRWGIYTLDSTYIQALTPGPFTPDHTQSKWIMVVCSMAKQLLHTYIFWPLWPAPLRFFALKSPQHPLTGNQPPNLLSCHNRWPAVMGWYTCDRSTLKRSVW